MKKILITGFMPFNNASLNPAWEAVKGVTAPEGVELVKKEISVVFGQAIDELLQAVEELHPDAVICVGLAQGRNGITPERVAINVNDARIPDNAGPARWMKPSARTVRQPTLRSCPSRPSWKP